MSDKHNSISGLYSLSGEVSNDALISHRDRNRFLIGFIALESLTGLARAVGVNIPPGVFAIEAGVTLLPAAASELSRRISLSMSRDFRDGARELVELDMITDESEWNQALDEPRSKEIITPPEE